MRIILFTIASALMVGCLKDKTIEVVKNSTPANICDSLNTDFTTVIQPLFMTNCATSGCHDANTNSSGYTYETYAQISGNAEIALKTMKHDPTVSPMPQFQAPLPDSTIQKVECWINKGKPQ